MRRLALVLVAGELAVDWGILPIQRAEILTSVLEIRDAWLRDLDVLPDAARGVELLRGFLLKHRIRLQDLSDQNNDSESQNGNALRLPRDLAGYIDRERHLYFLTLQGFREAVQGIDVNAVLRELAGRGLLFRNDKTRFTSKHRIPEVADRLSLYAIKFDILEAEDKE